MFKDMRYRKRYAGQELNYILYKSMFVNKFLPAKVRLIAYDRLSYIGCSKNRIKNRCVVSGRCKGLVKGYGFSRAIFKNYVKLGYLHGVSRRFF